MDRIPQIERRIGKIKQELAALGDMRPGSLSTQTRSWGGEYGQLSYTHQGKGHTEYVPKDKRKTVQKQLTNYFYWLIFRKFVSNFPINLSGKEPLEGESHGTAI